jgi:hypothetical protein
MPRAQSSGSAWFAHAGALNAQPRCARDARRATGQGSQAAHVKGQGDAAVQVVKPARVSPGILFQHFLRSHFIFFFSCILHVRMHACTFSHCAQNMLKSGIGT